MTRDSNAPGGAEPEMVGDPVADGNAISEVYEIRVVSL